MWNSERLKPFHISVPIHLPVPKGARVPSKYSQSIKNVDHWNSDYRSLSSEWPRAVAVSIDLHSRLVAVADQAGSLIIIDLESGNKVVSWQAHEGAVSWVGWSPDGHTLASLDTHGSLRLWNQEGKLLWKIPSNAVAAHASWAATNHLISVDPSGVVFRWNTVGIDLPETLLNFGGEASVFTVNKNGSHAVAALHDGTIRLLNLGKPALSSSLTFKPDSPATVLTLNAEGTGIAFVDKSGKIGVWSSQGGKAGVRYFKDDKWSNFKRGAVSSIEWNTKGDSSIRLIKRFF